MGSLTILHPLEDLISSLLPNGQHNIWPALLLFIDARQFSHFFALSRAEEWMVSLTHLHSEPICHGQRGDIEKIGREQLTHSHEQM